MERTSEELLPWSPEARRGAPRPVLFALRPRSYSEAIAETVAALRPGLDVSTVHPDALATEVERRAPALVLSAGPRPEGLDDGVRWAQFRPYEDPEVIRVDGVPLRFPGLGLEDLLGLIDSLCGGGSEAAL